MSEDPEPPCHLPVTFPRRPWRINSIKYRRADDYSDMLEVEFRNDRDLSISDEDGERKIFNEPRHCYDESQSLEILAAGEGWLHGEKFYMNSAPKFEDLDCYIQDFGFGPYQDPAREVLWRSIVEDLDFQPPKQDDQFPLGFFLRTAKAAETVQAAVPPNESAPEPC